LVFDGSSTRQAAEGGSSDCLLVPAAIYPDPTRLTVTCMTEVMNADGTPHSLTEELHIDDDGDFWFGFEQEYFIMDTKTLYSLVSYCGYPVHKECTVQ
jgi:glutamine synthetase